MRGAAFYKRRRCDPSRCHLTVGLVELVGLNGVSLAKMMETKMGSIYFFWACQKHESKAFVCRVAGEVAIAPQRVGRVLCWFVTRRHRGGEEGAKGAHDNFVAHFTSSGIPPVCASPLAAGAKCNQSIYSDANQVIYGIAVASWPAWIPLQVCRLEPVSWRLAQQQKVHISVKLGMEGGMDGWRVSGGEGLSLVAHTHTFCHEPWPSPQRIFGTLTAFL